MRRILLLLFLGTSIVSTVAGETFRVMTYNIHHGEGVDGNVDLQRIAALIKAEKADIVALQEVDRGTLRTTRRDMAAELAKLTGMNFCFEKNINYQGGEYGNAVLTRFPIVTQTNLHYQMRSDREQRGLFQVVLALDGRKVILANTHLDYRRDERPMNLKQIKETLAAYPGLPVILCGDFNERPGSRTYEHLSAWLTDSWKVAGKGNGFTFSGINPMKRLDYIWVSKDLRALKAWVPKTGGSDHLPVVAELTLE